MVSIELYTSIEPEVVEAVPEGMALATTNLPLPLTSNSAPASHYVTISSSLRSKVQALRQSAAQPFRGIANEFGIAVSTVYGICKAPAATPQRVKLGCLKLLNTPIRKQLITLATANQTNGCLPLTEIANLAGIQASPALLRQSFTQEGYHRRVA